MKTIKSKYDYSDGIFFGVKEKNRIKWSIRTRKGMFYSHKTILKKDNRYD